MRICGSNRRSSLTQSFCVKSKAPWQHRSDDKARMSSVWTIRKWLKCARSSDDSCPLSSREKNRDLCWLILRPSINLFRQRRKQISQWIEQTFVPRYQMMFGWLLRSGAITNYSPSHSSPLSIAKRFCGAETLVEFQGEAQIDLSSCCLKLDS